MLLFVCTAVLAALILGVKFTKDIFPKPLKLWLSKKAITNWMKSQPQKFGRAKELLLTPKKYADTGLISGEQEILAERPIAISNPAIRDEYIIYGSDENENGLSVKMSRFHRGQVHVDLLLTLDHSTYQMSYQGQALSPYEFSLGNLKMEMVEPFRAWRIWCNGIMACSAKEKKDGDGTLVHVALNFLWKALENPVDNRKNGNGNLLSGHLSSSGLFGENLPSLLKILPEGYSQMGTLHGHVQINGEHQYLDDLAEAVEDKELYLFGFRTREIIGTALETFPFQGKLMEGRDVDHGKRLELFAMCTENGQGFRLTSYNDGWTDGRMLWASYGSTLITHIDCYPSAILHPTRFPKLFNIYDSSKTARVEIWSDVGTHQLSNNAQITYLKMTINGRNANGILIRKPIQLTMIGESVNCSNYQVSEECGSNCRESCCGYDKNGKENYFLEFSNPACLKVPRVGGKGASLAKLERFSMQNSGSSEVKVARGFCVTTGLFRELLDLEKFIPHVFNNSSANEKSLEESCLEVMGMIKSSTAETHLSSLISPWIARVFGEENGNKIKFAVRSSGVLEDGSDLSSAGQNETFLGVPPDLISQKVVHCWASLFSPQSVRYRLNHGQPAVSEMGVVIQEMVDAESAGVIFSADPRTGNPFHMFITANYGLGESVVSGSCDPDFITLVRHGESRIPGEAKNKTEKTCQKIQATSSNNKWWKDVTIGKKVLGEKRTKIICTSKENDRNGATTQEIAMTDQESQAFCLNDDKLIKLGVVAAQIELFMGYHKPVDIEWAIDQNGQIFILQCRNLTALDAWTDFEILREMDAPIRSKLDRFTTANTGEVLPKAMHTITTVMNRSLDFSIQKEIYKRKGDPFPVCPYTNIPCPIFYQRLFLNMFQTLYVNVDKEISTAMVCVDQTVFGRQVIDEELRGICEERFGLAKGMSKLKDLLAQLRLFMTFKKMVEADYEIYKSFKLDYSDVPRKAVDVYKEISKDLIHIVESGNTHLATTQASSGSQVFLFIFLTEGKKPSDWSSSLYEDASKLLSVLANVESAEMPHDMDLLAEEIIKHGGDEAHVTEEFLKVSPEKALEWLRGTEKMSRALANFFEKHGHRGISEMDIGEPSWKGNPSSFLPILLNVVKNKLSQNGNDTMSGNPSKQKQQPSTAKSDDELLSSLSSNLNPITRMLLKLILPTCRNSVACREKSKSLYVRVIGQFKEKYQELAKIMVEEHLLPSESLIVHLTHFEIGQLVNKDIWSSTILQKAMKRQKMYPVLEKLKFPEICHGVPEELDTATAISITDTIQATPVSRGIARGVAKVCLSVQEAAEMLQPGDILITQGTDIAWSPFFPILGGVVTELGGLISHGAVVAREYGLPCIVGAVNATKIFKTGDQVVLDAGKGKLSKLVE